MSDMDFTSRSFEKFLGEKRLMGTRCSSCGVLHLPPRPLCPTCYGDKLEWVELSGRGKLLAFTNIYIAPTVMLEAGYGRKNPYCAGIVQLDEGPAISAQILGVDPLQPDGISIGTTLKVSYVERGDGEARKSYLAFTLEN
jgi:uncharacterized OB-fold protein